VNTCSGGLTLPGVTRGVGPHRVGPEVAQTRRNR
jgi:hypothetical protein